MGTRPLAMAGRQNAGPLMRRRRPKVSPRWHPGGLPSLGSIARRGDRILRGQQFRQLGPSVSLPAALPAPDVGAESSALDGPIASLVRSGHDHADGAQSTSARSSAAIARLMKLPLLRELDYHVVNGTQFIQGDLVIIHRARRPELNLPRPPDVLRDMPNYTDARPATSSAVGENGGGGDVAKGVDGVM